MALNRNHGMLYIVIIVGFLACGRPSIAQNGPTLVDTGSKNEKSGIHSKVIVSTESAKLYSASDGAETIKDEQGRDTIDVFSVFFELTDDQGNKTMGPRVRVGKADATPLGWINKDDIIFWNSRFVLYPRPPEAEAERNFKVFSKDDLGERIYTYQEVPKDRTAFAPILEDKEGTDGFPVALIVGQPKSGQRKSGPSGTLAREVPKPADFKLEVVFVIDTTASMTPLISGTKEVVRRSAAALAGMPELNGLVRFGLVVYQDNTPGLTPSRLVTPITDPRTFEQRLATVSAATIGSGETEEDVLAGLAMAIDQAGWSPDGLKHIILLGDASAHLSGPKNTTGLSIERVIARARKGVAGSELDRARQSIALHCVRAEQSDSTDLNEVRECKRQFELLAQNAGEVEGFHAEMDPRNPQSVEKTVKGLVDFLSKGYEGLQLLKKNDVAGLQKLINESDESINQLPRQFYSIAVLSGKEKPGPVQLGQAFVQNKEGYSVASRKLVVGRDELDRLRTTLDFLHTNLKGRVDPLQRPDVNGIVNILKQMVAIISTGEMEIDSTIPLERVISQLPLKTDALKISAADLQAYPEPEFRAWLDKLKAAKDRAADLLSAPTSTWTSLNSFAVNEEFTFIRLEEMP